MLAGMAVLLIACPCALGLATPMAVWLALGRASQSQVLFRHGDSLEKLAGVRTMFFDKTGTLSSGECEVVHMQAADEDSRDVVIERAGGLARASNHPYAMAIARFAADMNRDAATSVQNLPGHGITGTDPRDRHDGRIGQPAPDGQIEFNDGLRACGRRRSPECRRRGDDDGRLAGKSSWRFRAG